MAAMRQAHESCLLSKPTYCRMKHKVKPSLTAILGSLQNVMAAFSSCQQQEKMMSEAKLLHIMIYKRNRQLRKEKSLQLLKRVQACLKRASKYGRLFTLTDDIQKDLRSAVAEMKESETVYLPAQQTWSYLLYLHLQYVKLLDTNASFCIIAFKHLSCQLSSGMLIPQMIVFMAIVARIWLLSRRIAEKIQMCYNTVYSLRQHIHRTNSDWKDPELPPQLQLDNNHEVNTDHKAMLHTISGVPVTESLEMVQEKQHKILLEQNTFFSLDETEEEDIGVPVVVKRTADTPDSKKEKIEKSEIKMKKERKIKKASPSELDSVRGLRDEENSHFTTADIPKKKTKKRKLEELDTHKLKQKKIESYSSDDKQTVPREWSFKGMHDMEHCHSDQIPNAAADKKKSKKDKHKKIKKMQLSDKQQGIGSVKVGNIIDLNNSKKLKKNKKMGYVETKSNKT